MEADGFTFSYSKNAGCEFDQILIEGRENVLSPELSNGLVCEILVTDQAFSQAFLVDRKYEYLQNIFDPLQFKALGIPTDSLVFKSNGLPPPLERKVVDISQNPGRFKLNMGYVEAVGSNMWFGDSFWSAAGLSPETVQSKLPKDASMTFEGCWKIVASSKPFQSTESRRIQNEIRFAIFGS